ncbi:hypothetical protein HG530_002111 [Fusarium avenaceum]|nr:hypothetical protein HG530_002111 [Fusarium avenaceum]
MASLIRIERGLRDDGLAWELLFGIEKLFSISSSRIPAGGATTHCNGHAISRNTRERTITAILSERAGLAASPAWTAIPSPGATLLVEEALLGGGGSEPTIYELEKCSRWGVTAVASYGKPVADVWLQ